jgi:hypothetical protein
VLRSPGRKSRPRIEESFPCDKASGLRCGASSHGPGRFSQRLEQDFAATKFILPVDQLLTTDDY